MKNSISAFLGPFLVLWHALRGHPLENAREDHLQAIRNMVRAKAEVAYHQHLVTYFNTEAHNLDPHQDWRLFAKLKDKWEEHCNERQLETQKLDRAMARLQAAQLRLTKIKEHS